MTIRIRENLPYRIYGESVGIFVHVREKRIVILRNAPLSAFKAFLHNDYNHPAVSPENISCLSAAGLLVSEQSQYEHSDFNHSESGKNQEKSLSRSQVDLKALNYWAFRNHIALSGHFELTDRCNLRCKHCYCLFGTRDTLNTGAVVRIIDDLAENGTLGLVLTGGEIFTRPDIVEILQHIEKKRFVVRLNTNGVLIDESMVHTLQNFNNIYRIHISLYGPTPEVHDRITGVEGSFAKTFGAIRLLKEAGFFLRINCSLMQANADSYKRIRTEIGEIYGIPVHYDPFIFPKDDGDIDNMYEMLEDHQLKDFDEFEGKAPGTGERKLCKAAFSFFAISEAGLVYPCLKMKRTLDHSLGDLKELAFKEIWSDSPVARKIRNALGEKLERCSICDLDM